MAGEAKADVKLGFFIGVGLVLLALVLMVVQFVLGKIRGSVGGGG